MWTEQISRDEWGAFLRGFALEHAGERACVELLNPPERRDPRLGADMPLIPSDSDHCVTGHELTLRGLALEPHEDGTLGLTIDTDGPMGMPALYIVPKIAALYAEQPDGPAGGSLRVDSKQGQTLFIRLARPVVVESTASEQPVGAQRHTSAVHTLERSAMIGA